MPASNQLQMADLLPLPPEPNLLESWWPVLLALGISVLLLLLWRYRRNPYRRLLTRLEKGESARTIAHELAQLRLPSQVAKELEPLRFQASAPSPSQIKTLILRGQDG